MNLYIQVVFNSVQGLYIAYLDLQSSNDFYK